jgi:hypothetical protein
MKNLNLFSGLLALLLVLSICSGFGHLTDTAKAKKPDVPKTETGTTKPAAKPSEAPTATTPVDTSVATAAASVSAPISEYAILFIVFLFFVIMIFLFYKFFGHIKAKDQYIGFQSIKLIGLILMFPGICILALAGGGLIGGSTLAALLGTIAGYVLSREDDPKDSSLKEDYAKLKNDKEALDVNVESLKAEIEELKKQIPR